MNPIEHPAAWRGDELCSRPEWSLRFTGAELEELLTVAGQIDFRVDAPIGEDREPARLPLLRPKLATIQQQLEHGSGVVRLLGFPAESVSEDLAKRAMWCICRQVGTPISQSATGERMFSVRDAGFAENDSRARGPNTRKKLSFHTDRCDVIAFLCYRQAMSGGENDIVSSVTLYNEMLRGDQQLVETLMESYLYKRHNVDRGNEMPYVEQPIFSVYHGHFAANLLRVLIERAYEMPETPDMSETQKAALDTLEATAERPELRVTFRQEAGDILFLNNFVTFHRRTEFVDHVDPVNKRHLLRVWLSMPNSRPLDPRFAGNYGSTEAGAIRGGMQRQRL